MGNDSDQNTCYFCFQPLENKWSTCHYTEHQPNDKQPGIQITCCADCSHYLNKCVKGRMREMLFTATADLKDRARKIK